MIVSASDLSLKEWRKVRDTLDALYADDRRVFIAECLPNLWQMDTKRKTLTKQLAPLERQIKNMRDQKRMDSVFFEMRSAVDHLESEYDDLSAQYWSLHAKVTAAQNWLERHESKLLTECKPLPTAAGY